MSIEIARLILEYLRVLVWPFVVVGLCLMFRGQLVELLARVRQAKFPGGVSFDLGKEIQDVKELSAKVQEEPAPPNRARGPSIPLTEANARLLQLGFQPSPSGLDMSYYRNLAQQDPNIALAGLRIEIDVLARNLAKGFELPIDNKTSGGRLIRKLYDAGAISSAQMQLTHKVLSVCNSAVHGVPVSREEADDVIASAEILADHYLAWLSWGFGDDWKPTAIKKNEETGTSGIVAG